MRLEDLDRALSGEEEILPSSGFAVSVMDAVRREGAAPPPIRFPWARAIPGLAAAAIAIALALVEAIAEPGQRVSVLPGAEPLLASVLQGARGVRADWILVSLLLTLVLVALSRRLASSRI